MSAFSKAVISKFTEHLELCPKPPRATLYGPSAFIHPLNDQTWFIGVDLDEGGRAWLCERCCEEVVMIEAEGKHGTDGPAETDAL